MLAAASLVHATVVHSYGAAVTAEAAAAARLINTLGETSLINRVTGVISILY